MSVNFQGQDFSYSDLRISFMGNTNVSGVTAISFKTKGASENIMGMGREPVAFTRGAKEYEGSLTVILGTWMAMCKANGVYSLVDVNAFNIVVSMANGTDPVSVIELRNVRVLEDGIDGSAGDNTLPVELPIIFTSITGDWG